MTDRELDRLLGRILLGSQPETVETGEFIPSARYQRQTRAMLRDPKAWAARWGRPIWKTALYRAAAVVLAAAVSLGGLAAVSPTARAAMVRWFVEFYETYIVYHYTDEQNGERLPEVTMPKEFVEVERSEAPGVVDITYRDNSGTVLYLTLARTHQGSATLLMTNGVQPERVAVNGVEGFFYPDMTGEHTNTLTWVEESHRIQVVLDGALDRETMLGLAEHMKFQKN